MEIAICRTETIKKGFKANCTSRSLALGNGSHGKPPPKARQIAHPIRLFLKRIEQDPVAYAGGIACSSYLKCHESAVCRDYRIRCLAAFVVVEVGETGEILSRAIEAKHPDINVAPTALAAELFALAVSFNGWCKGRRERCLLVRYRFRAPSKSWSPRRS